VVVNSKRNGVQHKDDDEQNAQSQCEDARRSATIVISPSALNNHNTMIHCIIAPAHLAVLEPLGRFNSY
jgi:hypothetical protein